MKLGNLVLEAKKGNNEAFNEILERFKGFIYKTCCTIYISGYDMDDLIQIGNMTLVKAVQKYDPDKSSSFLSYAISSIKNNFYYEIRQKSRYNAEMSLNNENEDGMEFIDNLVSPEDVEQTLLLREDINILKQALAKLTPDEKSLIYYVYFKGGKLTDYARENNINYVTCAKRKDRILKKLRKLI